MKRTLVALGITLTCPPVIAAVLLSFGGSALAAMAFESTTGVKYVALFFGFMDAAVVGIFFSHFLTLVDDWDPITRSLRSAKRHLDGTEQFVIGGVSDFGSTFSSGDVRRLRWFMGASRSD